MLGCWQARCDGTYNGKNVNGYTQAWDFASTTPQRFQLNMWINDTTNQEKSSNSVPPDSLRINKVASSSFALLLHTTNACH